jgi:hypothetical protein
VAEAEPLIRRALAIDEASYGPDHPDVARDLNNLAELLHDTDREAEPLFRRSAAIYEESLGQDHPLVGVALSNLAGLLRTTNRLAEAEPVALRALEILLRSSRATGHEHLDLGIVAGNYARLHSAMGRSDAQIVARLDEIGRPFGIALGERDLPRK